jgi:hypothetical protein
VKRCATVLAALCLVSTVFAQTPECITYGDLPAALGSCSLEPFLGAPTAVALDPDHVLVHGAERLDVYDVSVGPIPQLVGSLEGVDDAISRGLPVVIGHHAYLANETGTIVDLADPAQPTVAGELGHDVRGLAARGTLLVASIQDGLDRYTRILDASDPLAPVLLGTVPESGQPIFLGDWLAVMASGIWIHDIADPAAPSLVTSIEYETDSGGSGPNTWYVTTRVLDAELLPDTLILVTNHHQQYGNWLYDNVVLVNSVERRRIDIADPLAPVETAYNHVRTTGDLWNFVDFNLVRVGDLMLEGREYFDPWSDDLASISVLPVRQPVPGGVMDLGDGRAAVCDDENLTLLPLDLPPVENIADPLQIPSQSSDGCAGIGIGSGFLAHLSSGYDEYANGWTLLSLHVGPGQPAAASEYWDGWNMSALACSGSLLAVADMLFHVGLDFSLTQYPLDLTTNVTRLTMPDQTRLAAVTSDNVLSLHDVSDPANALRVGETSLPMGLGHALDLQWQDGLILVGGSGKLAVVRVEAGLQPVVTGALDLADVREIAPLPAGAALVVAGDRLLRIDVSNPEAPVVVASRHAGVLNGPLLVQEGLAYATVDGLLSLLDPATLEPMGTLALDHAIADLGLWNGDLIGAGRWVRGFAYLPPACEVVATGVTEIPAAAAILLDVSPNPFNPGTAVRFALDCDQWLRLAVFDLRGRRVRELAGGVWPAGEHRVRWGGRGDRGEALPTGVYLVRLETAAGAQTTKAVLVK